MKVTLSILVAIALTAFLTIVWYISQPLAGLVFTTTETMTEAMAVNTTGSAENYTLLRLSVNVMIPFLIIIVWIWAIVYSQKTDTLYV